MGYYSISDAEFEDIKYGSDYIAVTSESIDDQSRWTTSYSQVFQNKLDETFWEVSWDRPSTEYQECDLDARKTQVIPVTTTVIKYIVKE
jgi:hypothetical protein